MTNIWTKIFLVLSLMIISLDGSCIAPRIYNYKRKPIKLVAIEKKVIKILSIDGGGVRGLIPIMILSNIESRLKRKKNITECFDIMAGTSAGGITVLMLNTPNEIGQPKYKASNLPSVYKRLVKKIFDQSLWHKITTFNGWIGDKYDPSNLETALKEIFGNTTFKNSIKYTIVPSYDLSRDKNYSFQKKDALASEEKNYYFKDIARGTSAAPTYFPPVKIQNTLKSISHELIDGGVSINNPTINAVIHALELYGRHVDFLIISLGTGTTYGATKSKTEYYRMNKANPGKLGWVREFVDLFMYSVNDVTDYQLQHLLPNDNDEPQSYYRLQITIEPEFSTLDDVSEENINALENYAKKIIEQNEEKLAQIATLLDA